MAKIDAAKLAAVVANLEGNVVADPEALQAVIEDYAATIDENDDERINVAYNLAAHEADETPHPIIRDIEKLGFKNVVTLTIASGAITITQGYHTLETEGGAATDDLDTINGGTAGDVLLLRTTNSSHDVTIKNGIGNILTSYGSDITLTANNSTVMLIYSGANWLVIGNQTGIFESGSNANGQYVRYTDGTQICWSGVTFTSLDITTTANGVFRNTATETVTFPAAFIDSNSVVTLVVHGVDGIWQGDTGGGSGLTGSIFKPSFLCATSGSYTFDLDYMAIGRWK